MEWSEFLNDLELNSSANPPNGKLLFKKVVHDVLECLSGFKECTKIIITQKDGVPAQTRMGLVAWEDPVDKWIGQIVSLDKQVEGQSATGPGWPSVLAEIGTVLRQVPELRNDVKALALPATGKMQLVVQMAIRLTKQLHLIWGDIQTKDYKRLWVIQRYGEELNQDS